MRVGEVSQSAWGVLRQNDEWHVLRGDLILWSGTTRELCEAFLVGHIKITEWNFEFGKTLNLAELIEDQEAKAEAKVKD